MKFKVGDRVKCIRGSAVSQRLRTGHFYTVEKVDMWSIKVNASGYWDATRFEHAKEYHVLKLLEAVDKL